MDLGRIQVQTTASTEAKSSQPRAVWRVQIEGIPGSLTVLRFARSSLSFNALDGSFGWPLPYEKSIQIAGASEEVVEEAPALQNAPQERMEDATNARGGVDASVEPSPDRPYDSASMRSLVYPSAQAAGNAPQVPSAPQSHNIAVLRNQEEMHLQALQQALGLSGGLANPMEEPQEAPAEDTKLSPSALMQKLQLNTTQDRPEPPARKSVPSMNMPKGVPPMSKRTPAQLPAQPPTEEMIQFENWLRLGLTSGHIPYNQARGLIHFFREPKTEDTPERTVALLVTPVIYQRYLAEKHPERYAQKSLTDIPREAWIPVQSGLLKHHPHRVVMRSTKRLSLFRFATKQGGVFQANVLTDPMALFGMVPEPNPVLHGEVSDDQMVKGSLTLKPQRKPDAVAT
jgi:hypothetical protein